MRHLKEVWTFAKDVSGFANNQYPAATVLGSSDLASDIYGATSTEAGVGAYQYEASWWRSTYNPPSHVTCAQLTAPNSGLAKPYSRVFPPPPPPRLYRRPDRGAVRGTGTGYREVTAGLSHRVLPEMPGAGPRC